MNRAVSSIIRFFELQWRKWIVVALDKDILLVFVDVLVEMHPKNDASIPSLFALAKICDDPTHLTGYITHEGDLAVVLLHVILVNTYAVDPE